MNTVHELLEGMIILLRFLVRDWANFDDDMSVKDCLAQMKEHLNQHMGESIGITLCVLCRGVIGVAMAISIMD